MLVVSFSEEIKHCMQALVSNINTERQKGRCVESLETRVVFNLKIMNQLSVIKDFEKKIRKIRKASTVSSSLSAHKFITQNKYSLRLTNTDPSTS